MKSLFKRSLFFLLLFTSLHLHAQEKYVMVIHGGAGTILKKNMSPEKEKAYTEVLTAALQKGYDALKSGKTSLDAVEATIHVLEDSPLFNAGKGLYLPMMGEMKWMLLLWMVKLKWQVLLLACLP